MRVFGAGTQGVLTIGTADWTSTQPTTDMQYTDVTVTGVWNVPSGLLLRCSGSFTVQSGAQIVVGAGTPTAVPGSSVTAGVAASAAGQPRGGTGLTAFEASTLLHPGYLGGGNGGIGANRYGGAGGGVLVVRAAGAVTVAGSISANGEAGQAGGYDSDAGGGGAGGVVVMVSGTSIGVTGSINARGGAGGNGYTDADPSHSASGGGGGGGGIVHLVAPSIAPGSSSVAGGAGGSVATTFSAGGGGACGGNGGSGADTDASPPIPAATAGAAGRLIQTVTSAPAELLL